MEKTVIPDLESLDITKARSAFAQIDEMVYLNTGTEGLTPATVLDRLIELTTYCQTHGQASFETSRAAIEESRIRVAGFLGVDADEIGFPLNATEAINWVAASLNFNPGDEVLLSRNEHPAMNFPWTYQRNLGRLQLKWFDISIDPDETLENIERAITSRTRLVALSHVDRHRGRRVPAERICRLAADAGMLVLLDGAQALGQFPVDLRELGVDFYAGNGHKWLCGPIGTGVFFVKKERLQLLTQQHVGVGSTATPYSWDRAGGPVLRMEAARFEYGTRNRATFGALAAALDWLEQFGLDAIQARISALAAHVRNQARDRGWKVTSPEDWEQGCGLTSFAIPDADAMEMFKRLAETRNIWISTNFEGEIRISTHYFNTTGEIDRAFEAIAAELNQTNST